MKIAVIGSTGFVGSHILKELIDRKYTVKAFARDISKISISNGVEVVALDVNDVDVLVSNLSDVDVVVSAYNAGWSNPNIYSDYMKGAQAIEEAVEKALIKRFIVVGGAGSLLVNDNLQLVDTEDFPEAFKQGSLASRDYLNILKKNNTLDWTFFSPAPEMGPNTSGVRRGKYRLGKDYPVMDENGRSMISVEDVAVVIVDEIESPLHMRQRFTAAY